MRKAIVGLLVVMLLVPSPAAAWGFETHKFIMSRAIDLLPDAIRPFFEANRVTVVEHVIDPDLWRNAGFRDEPPRHFLDIDAYGTYPFTELPRDYGEALRKHGLATLTKNGLLPWRADEMGRRLITAFQDQHKQAPYAPSDIKFFASVVGHYFSDANQPFHGVINYDGQLTGQHGVHFRLEEELFLRYGKQLNIRPGPLKAIANPRDFIFDAVLEDVQLVPAILAADLGAIGDGDVYDVRYFDAFFAKSRPILERRIADSITAVASMITSAWEQAGKPPLPVNPPPRPPQRRRHANAPPAATPAP